MSERPETQQPESPKPEEPKTERVGLPSDTITFDDFAKIKLRVGRVIEASEHPNADKLLVLKVDLGDEQRQIVAGLKAFYDPESLVGKNLIIVANLAPRKMRGLESQGMLLAASTDDHSQVIIATTDADIAPGSAVS
ncbi:MAG: methionine--tRNA ligase subunit beta [Planctomycetes bacterium]|nr:methionine--tRNA ligase subunit beta [Planctomycetota bacterium]